MKNICLILMVLGISFQLQGQTESIQQFYNKYKNLEDATHFKLQGWVLEFAAKSAGDDEVNKIFKKLSQLRFLSMEEANPVSSEELSHLIKSLKKDDFEELIQVRDNGERVDCYIRSKNDFITDVVLLISGGEEFLLLSLEGKLRFSDLNDLDIEVKGTEHFKKLPEDRSKLPKA